MNKEYNTIIIGGFGGSGSSAVVDLLKEVDSFQTIDSELRFIVDPDGIMSLDNILNNVWSPYQSDKAIKRFLKLINGLTKKNSSPYFRWNISDEFKDLLKNNADWYVKQLTAFYYHGKWMGSSNIKNWFLKQLNTRLNLNTKKFYDYMYISYPENEYFLKVTREFFNRLFNDMNKNGYSFNNIILDEGYSSLNPNRVLNYFNNSKLIIVDRDPRDIFVNEHQNMNSDFTPREVHKFVEWYRFLHDRSLSFSNKDILRINFEDLIYDYYEVVEKIFEFLSINSKNHSNEFKYLDPNISKKNIGIWEGYSRKDEIKHIFNNLKEYCYQKK